MTKKISVWRDPAPVDSDDEWIVSLDDLDDSGASHTLSTWETRSEAIEEAEQEAAKRELGIEVLPTHVGGDDGGWLAIDDDKKTIR